MMTLRDSANSPPPDEDFIRQGVRAFLERVGSAPMSLIAGDVRGTQDGRFPTIEAVEHVIFEMADAGELAIGSAPSGTVYTVA